MSDVAGIRNHALPVAIVATAATALAIFFTVWHPRTETSTQRPPTVRVPYSIVQFSASDARRAFASIGVRLVPKSHVPGVVTTLGTRDDAFEVDVFGDPAKVNANGSPDVITDTRGKYVRIPGVCTPGIPDAERWLQNVRFVIRCANPTHSALLASGTRALSKL